MSNGFAKTVEEDYRLILLKELAAQSDGRANETILAEAAYAYGHNKSTDYLRTQLNKLEELGATRNIKIGNDMIVAAITKAGVDHCLRRSKIEGIRAPSLGI